MELTSLLIFAVALMGLALTWRKSGKVVGVAALARDPQAGADLMERARKLFNIRDLFLTDLSISVAANLGPGTVGIVFFPVE